MVKGGVLHSSPTIGEDMSTSYIQKMERVQSSSFVGLWPLDEESGTVAYDISPNGYNATSSGLLRSNIQRSFLAPDGGKCAQFDGSASYINLYAAVTKEPTTIGSISLLAAVPQANLADTTKMQIITLKYDASNYIDITFDATAYRFNGAYDAAGTLVSVNSNLVYNVDGGPQFPEWHTFGLSWTKAGDALKFYVDGLQQGSTQDTLGTWAGAMASTTMVLGSSSTSAADVLTGYLARVGIWSVVLTDKEFADLAVIGL